MGAMNTPKQDRARVVELAGGSSGEVERRSGWAPRAEANDAEPTLADHLGTILENRFLIAAAVVAALSLAAAYVVLVAPTWRSDVLLQVEDKSRGLAGLDD